MWDVENQNWEHDERFRKIAEAASTKLVDPPLSFYKGRPYSWKLKEWGAHFEENDMKEDEEPAATI